MVAELSSEVWWSNTYSENTSFTCLLKRQRAVVLLSFSSCWDSARKVDQNSPVRDPRTGNLLTYLLHGAESFLRS